MNTDFLDIERERMTQEKRAQEDAILEIARLIKEGFTGGRVDSGSFSTAWDLTTNTWENE